MQTHCKNYESFIILFSQRNRKPLQMGLMVPFYMVLKREDRKEMIEYFWKSIYEDKGNRLIEMLDISYQLISFVCHY